MVLIMKIFRCDEDNVEDGEENNGIALSEVLICEVEEARNHRELRRNLQDEEYMSEGEEKQTLFLQRLNKQQRWKLYRLWLVRAEKHYLQKDRAINQITRRPWVA